jgi:hypothetical protein
MTKDNKNLNLIGELKAQLNTPKTETKIILNDWEPTIKKSKLSSVARNKVIQRHGSNYQSFRADIINPSYGPAIDGAEVKKYCSKCKENKEVGSSDAYCPSCSTSFGEVTTTSTTVTTKNTTTSYSEEEGTTTNTDGSTTEYKKKTWSSSSTTTTRK